MREKNLIRRLARLQEYLDILDAEYNQHPTEYLLERMMDTNIEYQELTMLLEEAQADGIGSMESVGC